MISYLNILNSLGCDGISLHLKASNKGTPLATVSWLNGSPTHETTKSKGCNSKIRFILWVGGAGENAHYAAEPASLFNPAHSPQISMNILKVEDPFSATT